MEATSTDFLLDKLIIRYQAQPKNAKSTINVAVQALLVILLIGFCYGAGQAAGEYYGNVTN